MPPKMFSDDYVYLLAPSSLLSGGFGQLKLSLAELPLETAWALPPVFSYQAVLSAGSWKMSWHQGN